ncbi:MAG: hypothetical protein Q9M40_10765 [Sulfurimonas sp.]|nr:hypothetical protein [Sulfurimonas sp.]
MKATKTVLSLAVMGTLTLGFAEVTTTIDAQIQAIQDAPASERVELMNEFKTQLSTMNEQERSEAIAQMRTQMQAKMQEHSESGEMNHEQMRTQTREHAGEMQMEHSEEMNRMQNMNQQQAGSQFGHDNERTGGSINMQNVSHEAGTGMFSERH